MGRLIVVSGPSGVGKGTVLKRLFAESDLALVLSVSATTRQPRPGEIDGVHYCFLQPNDFAAKRANGEFLESFEVFSGGHWYGTLRDQVLQQLDAGKWVVLEIDVQGAKAVKDAFPEAITVFIEPESIEVLHERLIGRATESESVIQDRLNRATKELETASWYQHRIVNANLDEAVAEFQGILDMYIRVG